MLRSNRKLPRRGRSGRSGRRAWGFFLLLLALAATPGRLQAQLPVWAAAYTVATGNQNSFTSAFSAIDANGDLVVAGTFQGSIAIGTLPVLTARSLSDVYVAKMNGQSRQWQWAVRGGGDGSYPTPRIDLSKMVVDGAGNVLLAGTFMTRAAFGSLPVLNTTANECALVAKLSGSTGTWLWATGAGGNSWSNGLSSLAVDGAGNAVVGGYFGQTVQFGNLPALTGISQNGIDGLVAGLNGSSGQWQWVKAIATTTSTWVAGVAVDAAGNVAVTGNYQGPLTLGTLPLLPGSANGNVFVAKLAPAGGQWLWASNATASGQGTSFSAEPVFSPAGEVIVSGSLDGGSYQFGSVSVTAAGSAAYLARLSGVAGTWQWVQLATHGSWYRAPAPAFDASGAIVAACTFSGTAQLGSSSSTLISRGSGDVLVSRTDAATGQLLWATRAGGRGTETVQSLRLDGSGTVWLTGTFQNIATFGTLAPITGGNNSFVAQLSLSQFGITDFSPVPNALAGPRTGPVAVVYSQPLASTAPPLLKVFGDLRQGFKSGVSSQMGAGGLSDNVQQFVPTQPFSPNELVSISVSGATAATGGPALPARVYQFRAATGGAGRGLFSGADSVTGAWQSALLTKGDLDNDGDLDILSAGPQAVGFTPGLNDGTGRFAAGIGFSVRGTVTALTLADVDADGDLDLAWAAHYPSNDSVLIRFNTGNGSFGGLSKVAVGANPRSLVFGDLDADGDLDLLVGSYQAAGSISVRLNNGAGSFAGSGSISTGTSTFGVALGDLDNDGDLDVVATNEGDGTVATAFNNGAGSFGPAVAVAAGALPHEVVLADVDGDGMLDFVDASAQASATTMAIGHNNGAGAFGVSYALVGSVGSFSIADIDADGDADLLTTDPTVRIVRIWLNTGAGTFNRAQSNQLNAPPATLVLGDLDGDGDIDWLTANSTGTLSPRFNTGVALAAQPAHTAAPVAVFPNPAHRRVTVQLSPGKTPAQLILINAVGQEVMRFPTTKPGGNNDFDLDLSNVQPGIYRLQIIGDNLNTARLLVIE